MAAKKYIMNNAGRLTEEAAITTSAGAGDDGKIVALDATGKISTTMMPVGVAADTAAIAVTEALAAGALVNVYNSSGRKARNADATAAGKEATGFVLSAFPTGSALVYFEGTITGLVGLTPGARYYTSASSPGAITATAPSGASNVVQFVGIAISDTELSFEPSEGFILAA